MRAIIERHRIFLAETAGFLAVYAFISRNDSIRHIGDSQAYRTIAAQPVDAAFLLRRPPLYPLLLKALDNSDAAMVALQFLAYAAAWIFLAYTLYRRLSGRRGTVVAALAFYFALYPDFAGWTHIVLTESLSFALSVAGMGFLLRLADDGRAGNLAGVVVLSAANAMLRDVNGLIALLVCLPLTVLLLRKRISLRPWVCGAAVLMLCQLAVMWSVDRSAGKDMMAQRWVYPMLNVIGTRILPAPAATRFFADAGMPVTPALRAMSGKQAAESGWAFYDSPDLADFRTWLLAHGRTTYARFLIAHAPATALSVAGQAEDVFHAGAYGSLRPYPDPLYATAFWPRLPLRYIYVWDGVGACLLLGTGFARRQPVLMTQGALCVALCAMLPPLAVFIYCADSMELARHALPVPLYAVLTGLLTVFFCARGAGVR